MLLNPAGEDLEGPLKGRPFELMPRDLFEQMAEYKDAKRKAIKHFKAVGCRQFPQITFGRGEVLAQYYPHEKPWPKLIFIFAKQTRGGIIDRTQMSEVRYITLDFEVVTPTHLPGHA